jgi:hypothetical protein
VNLPVPWFLEREYPQHRRLDPQGLPPTFAMWRARARKLARLTEGRAVRVIIHPGELEAWTRQIGCTVNDEARSAFAKILLQTMRWSDFTR